MEFLSIMYQLIFMPLQIIFEVIYYLAFRLIGNPGVSIIALSFIVNLLVLPLYNRADAIQEAERDMEVKLSKGVDHIKKTFKGDEQLMMLQTYYRQNGYSPLDSIKGSISLFLEVPFFVAAYQFLSHLEILNGASLGPVRDLGAPDSLLTIAGMSINVLPFVMTAVNLISAYIFTKDMSRKTKIQLYGMACFFLVFLYASPAGLVFYWTFNNIFNFIKTIICKLDDVDKGIDVTFGILSIAIVVYGCFFVPNANANKVIWTIILSVLLNARLLFKLIRKKLHRKKVVIENPDKWLFYSGTWFLALLIGALIPSTVIESSPKEFLIAQYYDNPIWYVVNSFSIAIGAFVIWGGVFYWLVDKKTKNIIERFVWFASISAMINYMVFNYSFGVLNTTLHYENRVSFNGMQRSINLIVLIVLAIVLNVIWRKYKKNINEILLVGIIAMLGMTMVNIFNIHNNLVTISSDMGTSNDLQKSITLSKNGKNVILIMLDRAMGEYIPYIFSEKPELREKFAGFTYYSNVISHGGHTIFGAPGIFGGYEYTPAEINRRNEDTILQKHSEASNLLPELFSKSGYNIITNTSYTDEIAVLDGESAEEIVALNNRNFYFFGIFKTAPVILQKYLYDNGDYLSGRVLNQEITSLYTSFGINKNFMREYKIISSLSDMSKVNENGNNFLRLINNTTHIPCLLQMPDYKPLSIVNNLGFISDDWVVVNERKLNIKTSEQMGHYHVNMAALLRLAEWFDYMRMNGVYDNSRIILVSDHGYGLRHFDDLVLDNSTGENVEWYYPLLLVKDFGSNKFVESEEFMTNAEVVNIALEGIINEPVNPFTGKRIVSKKDDIQYVFGSREHSLKKHGKNVYAPGVWYAVHTNIWNKNNWKVAKKDAVLPY